MSNQDSPLHRFDERDAAAQREDDWRALCDDRATMTPEQERAFWIALGCDVAAKRDAARDCALNAAEATAKGLLP